MANTNKNILITPNTNTSNTPKIEFTGFDNAPLTLDVLDPGSLKFSSAQGTLFFMSPEAEGDVFKITNVSGVPILRANNSFEAERVVLVPYGTTGKVGVGTNNPSAGKLSVSTSNFRNSFSGVTPNVSDCVLGLSNFPGSEASNYHTTIQFNVNGGSYNRVGSFTFGAESGGNRLGYFAFCVDDGATRPERVRITSSGRLGVGTNSPSGTIHAAGTEGSIYYDKRIYNNGELNMSNAVGDVSAQDLYHRFGRQYVMKQFSVYFPHSTANRALKIWFGQQNHWGGGELYLTGTYSYQNMAGLLKYYWTRNSNSASNYGTYFEKATSMGVTENNFRLEEFGYDSTAARSYMIIQHRVSTGNTLCVTLMGIGIGPRNYPSAYHGMYAEMITRTP
jgi:hypothetical protein